MEDALEAYHRPCGPKRPVACMGETNRQLFKQARTPLPAKPGEPGKGDGGYERNGVAGIFLFAEPLAGRRRAAVAKRRTAADGAHRAKEMLGEDYPLAGKGALAMDHWPPHGPWPLCEALAAPEARRLAERLGIHHAPKHGSWLDMAGVELPALSKQCLSRRIPGMEAMDSEVAAWASKRNAEQAKVDGHFTTEEARIKLKRLYPVLWI